MREIHELIMKLERIAIALENIATLMLERRNNGR